MYEQVPPPTIEQAWEMSREEVLSVIGSGVETLRDQFYRHYVDTTLLKDLAHYFAELTSILEAKTAIDYYAGAGQDNR